MNLQVKFRMLLLFFILSVVGAVVAEEEVLLFEPLSLQMIDYVNNHANTTWKVGPQAEVNCCNVFLGILLPSFNMNLTQKCE